jgi:hypothetical protein
MNGVEANSWPRMKDTRLREPSIHQLVHSLPVQVMFQDCCNLCVGVFVEQMIDLRKNRRRGYVFFPAIQSDRHS